ncbi:MAG: DUF421 domain-containing protein, partial [Oscillospiraceae bacterium]
MGIVPILTLVCVDVIVSSIMLKSVKFRKFMIGSPRVIISNGQILQDEMKKLRYTVDDLIEAMRGEQIFDITQVHYAIVETTGKISFMLKKDYQNAEKKDVSAGGSTADPPTVIIRDGLVDRDKLEHLNLKEKWLSKVLNENSVTEHGVFLMTADKGGSYTIVKKEKAK